MKLFVWSGFSPDYTNGLAFAIAKDESDARQQVIKEMGYEPHTWGTLSTHRVDRRVAKAVSGGS